MNVLLIAFLIFLVDVASDMYIPSLPLLPKYFCTTLSSVQMSISMYLVGLTASTLFYGVLADIYGRKKVIISGLLIFCLSTVMCYFSTTISSFIFARTLQGIGGGVSMTMGYTCISDLYSGPRCAQLISRIGMVIALSPAFGPIIGGWIALNYGWKMIFLIIFALSAILLAVFLLLFRETKKSTTVIGGAIQKIIIDCIKVYAKAMCNKGFLLNNIVIALTFSNLWTEIVYTPIIFEQLGVAYHKYGVYVSIMVIFYVIGTIINHHCVKLLGISKSILLGTMIIASGDFILLANIHQISHIMLTAAWAWSAVGLGIVIGSTVANAIGSLPQEFNSRASALIVAIQMSSAALGLQVCGFIAGENFYKIISMLTILSSSAFLVSIFIKKSHTYPC